MKTSCAVNHAINILGKDWALLILLELNKGKNEKRFSELKRSLNSITPKILSLRLKELEKEKLIIKKVNSTKIPIKSEYSLTKSGKDIMKIITEIKKWSVKYHPALKSCENSNCKNCVL